ncbi:hypothetical protein NEHOM01_2137, partial [Nematocida homosporus]|uniref:uncharacterized protein n=1 Tax=Nematocida homosporus TaxID=1912981 RepID=UPI00221F4653
VLFLSSLSSCYFIIKSNWLGSLYPGRSLPWIAIRNFAANIIIFSNLVPLSLFVTLDGLRVAYSVYIQSDRDMAKENKFAECSVYGVIEDIGLITHVLTDKTGTLTENQMVLIGMHLKGREELVYLAEMSISDLLTQKYAGLNLLAMLLCHSVEVVGQEYRGVSQEEMAILSKLAELGLVLLGREDDLVSVQWQSQVYQFQILAVMPFSSSLSRMGVVAQVGDKCFLFVKGSEEVVPHETLSVTDGRYRVLSVAAKELSATEILSFQPEAPNSNSNQNQNQNLINNSNQNTKEISIYKDLDFSDISIRPATKLVPVLDGIGLVQELEAGLEYIGTIYIEDMIQANANVAIQHIKQKNIKIWMITGDRKESALSCASSTRISHAGSKVLSGRMAIDLLQEEIAQGNHTLKEESGVIVYRATPDDKKEIVHLLRKEGSIVLSVGDGENDVGMIEEADIGVCILGKEGKKAAFVADVIIPSFFAMAKLVVHHGTICLERLKAVYFFYIFKCVAGAVCQCLYGISVGSSGSIASSSLFLIFYNSLITSPLSVEIGLFRRVSTVQSVKESVLSGCLYGGFSFLIVYQSFGPVDIISQTGTLAGHSLVSRVFSLCLYISTLNHFIFISDSFVWMTPVNLMLSVLFFLISIGFDGGFDIFLYPSLYLIIIYMITVSVAIERFIVLLRKDTPYTSTNLSTPIESTSLPIPSAQS